MARIVVRASSLLDRIPVNGYHRLCLGIAKNGACSRKLRPRRWSNRDDR